MTSLAQAPAKANAPAPRLVDARSGPRYSLFTAIKAFNSP